MDKSGFRFRVMCCAAAIMWSPALSIAVAAQGTTGSIVGTAQDPSRAVLPGVTVIVKHIATGVDRTSVTGEAGTYEFPFLPIGEYEVTGALQGFAAAFVPRARLEIGQRLRVDLSMKLSGVSETVTVEGGPTLITTEQPGLSHVVTGAQIAELPLNERDVLSFVQQLSGAGDRRGGGLIVSGNRAYTTNYVVEGLNNTDESLKTPISVPPVDAVQEMELKSSLMNASSGSASSSVSLAIKSGTNAFHGSAYDYYRSNLWEARNFFNPTDEVPNRLRHQFGATLGGPVWRGRTFFFGSYSGLRLEASAPRTGLVPTDAMRSGDFSALGLTITNPHTGARYTNGIIPRSAFHPVALKILDLLPAPNTANPKLNYFGVVPETDSNNQWIGRIDHELTGKDRLTVYGNMVGGLRESPGDGIPGIGNSIYDRKSAALLIRHTRTLTSNLVNEFSVGATRLRNFSLAGGGDKKWLDELGITGIPLASDFEAMGFPDMRMTPYVLLRDITQWPDRYSTNNFSFVNNLSWLKGRHAIQAGFDIRRNQLNQARRNYTRGQFIFQAQPTGHVFASVLMGSPRTVLASTPLDFMYLRKWDTGYYVQDTWKASNRLTLSLGLRYELFTNGVEKYNRMSGFDPKTGQIVVSSNDGELPLSAIPPEYFTSINLPIVPSTDLGFPRSLTPTDTNNFAPRVGLAYKPFGENTVVRGGFGIYYYPQKQNRMLQGAANPPFTTTIRADGSAANGWLDMSAPFAGTTRVQGANILYATSPDYEDGYYRNYDVTYEQQLGDSLAVRASYVGNQGRKLNQITNLNKPLPEAGPNGTVVLVRPYPQMGSLLLSQPLAETDYNALELEVKRRYSRGFSFQVNYTLARAMATADLDDWEPLDVEPQRERGRSSFVPTHMFNVNGIYALPFGEGQRFLSSRGISNAVFGGWNVAVLAKMRSGMWFTPYLQHGRLADRGNQLSGRPNLVPGCDPNDGPRTTAQWFNVSCYTPVPGGDARFGNAPRTSIEGPGLINADAAVYKKFSLPKNMNLTFRVEAFNVLNRANFTLAENSAVGNVDITFPATSGNVRSTITPSRQFQFAFRLDF